MNVEEKREVVKKFCDTQEKCEECPLMASYCGSDASESELDNNLALIELYKKSETKEAVNHPSHYNQGKYEVIDVIEDWGLNFSLGSAVKYIARCDYKEHPIQDLEKAKWFVDREIQRRKNDHGGML